MPGGGGGGKEGPPFSGERRGVFAPGPSFISLQRRALSRRAAPGRLRAAASAQHGDETGKEQKGHDGVHEGGMVAEEALKHGPGKGPGDDACGADEGEHDHTGEKGGGGAVPGEDEAREGGHAVDHDFDVDELQDTAGHEVRAGVFRIFAVLRGDDMPCQPDDVEASGVFHGGHEGGREGGEGKHQQPAQQHHAQKAGADAGNDGQSAPEAFAHARAQGKNVVGTGGEGGDEGEGQKGGQKVHEVLLAEGAREAETDARCRSMRPRAVAAFLPETACGTGSLLPQP